MRKWIRCIDKMPASHEPVYIFHPHYGVDQSVWYDDQENSFFWDSDTSRFRLIETVSHWMEMPELPPPPEE